MSLAGFVLGKPYRRLGRTFQAAANTLNGVAALASNTAGLIGRVKEIADRIDTNTMATAISDNVVQSAAMSRQAAAVAEQGADFVRALNAASMAQHATDTATNLAAMVAAMKDAVDKFNAADPAGSMATLLSETAGTLTATRAILDQAHANNIGAEAAKVASKLSDPLIPWP